MTAHSEKPSGRDKILAAALRVIRAKGYAATTVDELCAAAGVTKGAFFHHFKSKDELAVAAADYWSETTGAFFAAASYHAHADPLDRVLGYIDFRKAILTGTVPEFTCLVGTMVQEAYDTHPAIRAAVDRSISAHAGKVEIDIEEAIKRYRIEAGWSAAESSAPYSGSPSGGFHPGQGEGRRRCGGGQRRPPAPLCRTAVQGLKHETRRNVTMNLFHSCGFENQRKAAFNPSAWALDAQ